MKKIAEIFEELDATTSTNRKVDILAEYFTTGDTRDVSWALHFFLGKNRKHVVSSRDLRRYFQTWAKVPDWLFAEAHSHVGDSAEVITLLLGPPPFKPSTGEELPLWRWMEERIPALYSMEDEERSAKINEWWSEFSFTEMFVFNKILTGSFRVGIAEKIVIRAAARAFSLPETLVAHRLMGQKTGGAELLARLKEGEDAAVEASRPYPFFLASPVEADKFEHETLAGWLAEWKWDGIRAQVIRRGGEVFIWSRGEELLTTRFPELVSSLRTLPEGTVVDGEIVAWRDSVLPFAVLQTRIGRKNLSAKALAAAPVRFIAFDLLEDKGIDLRADPLASRREKLAELFAARPLPNCGVSETLKFETWDDLVKLRQNARELNVEGLMLKRLLSPYRTGRKRGDWWKFKVDPLSLDAVLIYAQAGSGKRSNLFTDYTFALRSGDELVTFAKAYSGLSNAEIEKLDRWIRKHTKEKFGPVRAVDPELVFEIAFEGISLSKRHKSGIAVRFPRIMRWRSDKTPADADDLDTARRLIPGELG